MPLSKAKDAARKRNERALASGIQPSPTQLVEAMPVYKRKERLAELIATPIEADKVTASHVIQAIDVYNKMDKIYSETPPNYYDNRTLNFIVSSDKAKQLTENIEHRLDADDSPKLLVEGEDDG